MQTATNPRHLLEFEIQHRLETGHDLSVLLRELAELGGYDALDAATATRLLDAVERSERGRGWSYVEPDDLDEIRSGGAWPATPEALPALDERYADTVHRAWQGRIVGNMLGKPVEYGVEWTPAAIRAFLEEHDAWPLRDYFPAVADTGPGHPPYIETWVATTQGNVDGSCRDDDIDYTILNLHLLRTCGADFDTEQVAALWLGMLPFLQTYTAERVAIRNLLGGVPLDQVASVRNPYREYIGAAIRADVFGFVCPGDPARAAELAHRDAVLSHVGNGVYSAMWCAALVAAAFTADSALDALRTAIEVVPRGSRLREAIEDTLSSYASGSSWEQSIARIEERYGQYNWVHAVNNAAVLTAGLIHGDGDFDRSIALTVCGGLDTDSNGATAGSVAAILAGAIDPRWTDPLHDRIRSAVFGYDGSSIADLARATVEVATVVREDQGTVLVPTEDIRRQWW